MYIHVYIYKYFYTDINVHTLPAGRGSAARLIDTRRLCERSHRHHHGGGAGDDQLHDSRLACAEACGGGLAWGKL